MPVIERPSIDSDHVSRADAFRRTSFAASIAPLLCRKTSDDAIVVGLEGEWGCGKTHLLGQIRHELNNSGLNPVIVEFNPWLIANTESLVLALLGQLAARIGTSFDRGPPEEARQGLAVSRRLLGYLSALQRVATPALLLVDPTGTASGLASTARNPLDTMTKAIDDLALPNRLAKADVFARKQAVEDALRELNQPVVVIVDDLDRLQNDEIRSVFQAIKAVADFPGIAYLLAYDPKRVAKAFDDPSFAEKIVQVSYPIPHLHFWDKAIFVKREIVSTLDALGYGADTLDADPFNQATRLAARLCRHPRDVIRLCNRLHIAIPALQPSISTTDILVMEAVTLVCPAIADAMRLYPTHFTYHPHPFDDKDAEDDWVHYYSEILASDAKEPPWQQHIPSDTPNRAGLAKALAFLFLREPQMVISTSAGLDRRLRHPELFAHYLQLNTTEGIPSPAAIDDMLSTPGSLADALDQAGEDTPNLLNSIVRFFPQKELSAPPAILDCFLLLLKQSNPKESSRIYDSLQHICHYVIKFAPSTQRVALMHRLVDSAPLGVSERAVVEMAKEHGLIRLRDREQYMLPDDERFIGITTEATSLVRKWKTNLQEAVTQQRLHSEPLLHRLLHRWHMLEGSRYEEVWELTRLLCQREDGLRHFINDLIDGAEEWKWSNSFEPFLHLVWNPQELAQLIEQQDYCDQFVQLRTRLVSDETAKHHADLRALDLAPSVSNHSSAKQ